MATTGKVNSELSMEELKQAANGQSKVKPQQWDQQTLYNRTFELIESRANQVDIESFKKNAKKHGWTKAEVEAMLKVVSNDLSKTKSNFQDYTDIANAERFLNDHNQDLIWSPEMRQFFRWSSIAWEETQIDIIRGKGAESAKRIYIEAANEPDPDTRARLAKWAIESANLHRINAMIELAKPHLIKKSEDLDRDGMLLNCKNGTIELKTGNLRPHDRKDFITKMIDVEYDPAATAPQFEAFIGQIFLNNPEVIRYVQCALGYSITSRQDEQVIFIAHGEGENGKSTLINVITELLGTYAQSAAPDLIIKRQNRNNTNDIARMRGKRFAFCMELGEDDSLDEERLKRLTGGDKLTARFLHKEFVEFRPSHKLWLITNHLPKVRGTDHAIWRRLKKIPFTFCVPKDQKDPGLADKLRAEFPGILNWLIKGCMDWQENRIVEPTEVQIATNQYREDEDLVAQFIAECLDTTKGATSTKDLYAAYLVFSDDKSITSSRTFGKKLAAKGLVKVHETERNGYRVTLRAGVMEFGSLF